jgi:hypothetical protein
MIENPFRRRQPSETGIDLKSHFFKKKLIPLTHQFFTDILSCHQSKKQNDAVKWLEEIV